MMGRLQSMMLWAGLISLTVVSGYDDRPPMNENRYFEERMADRHDGHGLYQEPQNGRRYGLLLGALAGFGLEWFWTGRTIKKINTEHEAHSNDYVTEWYKDRDALMARRTYPIKMLAHQVEEADLQLAQLLAAAEDAGVDIGLGSFGGGGGGAGRRGYSPPRAANQDTLDYEEFRQPDVNGDNVISKAEFNHYIKQYLIMYPDTPAVDIPRFEDFDVNRDGVVTFDEWQLYLDRHREAEQYRENEMLRGMYDTSANSQGFDHLAQNIQRAQRRRI